MKFNSESIETILKQQRDFHTRQIELIDLALTAVQAKSRPVKSFRPVHQVEKTGKHRIKWTRNIKEILEDYSEFTILHLQRDLAEKKAITAAQTPMGKNMIINVLSRLKKKGLVQRISPGVYRVIKERLSG